jgi:hypothetical protein
VAAYSKRYRKDAQDVAAAWVGRSRVEPILQNDITTHMCSAVGGSASGIISLLTGYILLEQQRIMMAMTTTTVSAIISSTPATDADAVTDVQVFQDTLLAFVLCYTLIFTVMEPLQK